MIKRQHNLRKVQERRKAQADMHRHNVKYSVGDRMQFDTPGKGHKEVAVKLQLHYKYQIRPNFHVSLLRPYHQSEHTVTSPPPLQVDADGAPGYEFEEVLYT
eukprot:scaffold213535_cov17-Tisochrysis_lutea.AAC.1